MVTGAADDDPSGIATYTQAGAQFGTSMVWTVFLSLPFMIAIQLVSARIGRVTGKGVAANLRDHTPRWFLLSMVLLLVIANVINIAADVAAMGRGGATGSGRAGASVFGSVWPGNGAASGAGAVSPLGTGAEVAHPDPVCLCGGNLFQ